MNEEDYDLGQIDYEDDANPEPYGDEDIIKSEED